jgi:hypothetical protein
MNIKQALKFKNKLTAQIKSLYEIAKDNNSIEQGNPRRYSIIGVLNEANELTKELVDLKAKIHKANQPVYHKIFLMSELKGRVKQLKAISCEEGKVTERYGSIQSVKEVEIDIVQKNEMIQNLELHIELLQDELDMHNATTQIN